MKNFILLILVHISAIHCFAQKLTPFKNENGNYGYKNIKGKVSIKAKYYFAFTFVDGLAVVCNENKKCGCINEKGKIVIPLIYDSPTNFYSNFSFSNGLICMSLNYKFGFLDKTGKVVIPFKYEYARNFSDDVTEVSEGYVGYTKVQYFIDKSGNKLFSSADYSYVADFKNGISNATKIKEGVKGFLYGVLDKKGNEVIPVKYESVYSDDDGYFLVKENAKYGWYNHLFELIIPIKYDDYADSYHNGFITVKENGKWGCLNKNYKFILPVAYDNPLTFQEGLCAIKFNGLYGFADTTGKIVIPFQYQWANNFTDGKADVHVNGEKFSINKTGAMIEGTISKLPAIEPPAEIITDVDGNHYSSIKIGTQTWMKSNLWVQHYRNGEPIELVTENSEWESTNTGAASFYKNDEMLSLGTGLLYNNYVVNNIQNVCPTGWHIPSEQECLILINTLAGARTYLTGNFNDDNGEQMKATVAIKSTSFWEASDRIIGTNSSGFGLNPTGMRDEDGEFRLQGHTGYFWTANQSEDKLKMFMLTANFPVILMQVSKPTVGYPIRCIKD